MPVQYGQKNWRASGTPIVLDADQSTFLYVRMPRFASISGIIVDENDVGLPEHEVAAFRNTRPPQLVTKAQADDRGVYRIFRTGARNCTWKAHRGGGSTRTEAICRPFITRRSASTRRGSWRPIWIRTGRRSKWRPIPGLELFNIAGSVDGFGTPMVVTLVSDVGRESVTTNSAFQFFGKPPGNYELYAEAPSRTAGTWWAMARICRSRWSATLTSIRLPLMPMPWSLGSRSRARSGGMEAAAFKIRSKPN